MKTNKTEYGSAVPIYCSSSFKWRDDLFGFRKKNGTCNESDLIKLETQHMVGNYDGIVIRSSKTGQEKYFEPVYDEDGYDGELMVYSCDGITVEIWNY